MPEIGILSTPVVMILFAILTATALFFISSGLAIVMFASGCIVSKCAAQPDSDFGRMVSRLF